MSGEQKALHTRGPWTTQPEEVDRSYIRVRGTQLGGRYKVANVLTPVYEGSHMREAEETRANARLIAAAPNLLMALEMLYAETADYIRLNKLGGMDNHCMRLAREALAKALGHRS